MAEATATREISPEQRQQLEKEWDQYCQRELHKPLGQVPYSEKQSIMHMIMRGIGPVDYQQVPQEAKANSWERIQTQFDRVIDAHMLIKQAHEQDKNREREGGEVQLGHVLRPDSDWTRYGAEWTEGNKNALRTRLREVLGLNAGQIDTTLGLLLINGRGLTPEQLLSEITTAKLSAAASQIPGDYRNVKRADAMVFLAELGVDEVFVQRFVFPVEMSNLNESNYQSLPPGNMEETAWQMMWNSGTKDLVKWGAQGKTPLLELRVKKEDGKITGDYHINEANVVRWLRDRMMNAHNFDPDLAHNFFSEVTLRKQFAPIQLIDMLLNPSQYFISKTGKDYIKLNEQLIIESWALTTLRQWDVDYRGAMTESKLIETIQKLFKANTFTKETFKTTLINLLSTLPLNYERPTEDGAYHTDNKLGAAWIQTHLAYDSLSDFEGLQTVLGRNSKFFTEKGMLDAFGKVLGAKEENTGGRNLRALLGEDLHSAYEKAFDSNGKVKDKKNFIKLINIFATFRPSGPMEKVVRQMLQDAIQENFDIGEEDEGTVQVAELIAWSWSRISGAAALGDNAGFIGYDYNTRMFYTQSYRKKMAGWERGDYFGNPFTVYAFKRMNVDLFRAMKTETWVEETDHNGRKFKRYKMPIEIFRDLHVMKIAQMQALHEAKERLKGEGLSEEEQRERLSALQELLDQQYQNKAAELNLSQRAMEDYADNHLARGYKLYDIVMKSRELDLEKFTHFDVIRGITFDREKFQEAVQEKFFKQLRYNWSSYGELDFAKVDRYLDQGTGEFREMPLGESLFGYQMLNREFFWQKTRKNGKWEYVYDDFGRHVIDYHKINETHPDGKKGKVMLWKQWALMKIGAELHAHMSRHSTDPAFNFGYYIHVIEALESIPGNVLGDEFDMKDTRTPKHSFFSEKDIAWLRNMAKIEEFDLSWKWILSDLFTARDEKGMGFGEAAGIFFKAIAPS